MKNRIRHITTFLLLCLYISAGVGAQYVVLGKMLNSGSPTERIGRARHSPPIDNKPYWTSYKHIPPAERTHGLSDALTSLRIDRIEVEYISILFSSIETHHTSQYSSSFSLRGPPLG